MILAALKQYYDSRVGQPGGPPADGYAEASVVGAITLNNAGQVTKLLDLRVERPRLNKKGDRLGVDWVPRTLVVPQVPKRTVAIKAGFLCDNARYLLGHVPAGEADTDQDKQRMRARATFSAARTLHEAVLAGVDDPAAAAILAFFQQWRLEDTADLLAGVDPSLVTGWLVFRLEQQAHGAQAHTIPALRDAWAAHREGGESPVRGQCLLTGAPDQPIALIHPAIKGVPGAQSAGAALVSFNLSAFQSYGKSQNANAPISERAAFAYTTALNHLLRRDSKQKLQLGETTIIVWADQPGHGEQALMRVFSAEDSDAAREQLERIARGLWASDPTIDADVRFYVLGLAPNAGRLQIRFFLTDTLGVFLSRMQQHCQDLLFTPPAPGVRVPSLAALARAMFPYDAAIKLYRLDEQGWKRLNRLSADLIQAVLAGHPYPGALLGLVLDRLRHDRHLTADRAGLIKAIINRARRNAHPPAEEFAMALDHTRSEPGYLVGRLLAVMEQMQWLSRRDQETKSGKTSQPTIYDRFAAAAASAPGTIWPTLSRLSDAHFQKARRGDETQGSAKYYRNRMQDIYVLFENNSRIPMQLDVTQQGVFYLGYFHERAALRSKKTTDSNKEHDNDDDITADPASETSED